MTHAADGYSKIHKWEFRDDGSVAFTSKFLRSGFYEESEQIQDIALSVMAQPTEPPLDISLTKMLKTPKQSKSNLAKDLVINVPDSRSVSSSSGIAS